MRSGKSWGDQAVVNGDGDGGEAGVFFAQHITGGASGWAGATSGEDVVLTKASTKHARHRHISDLAVLVLPEDDRLDGVLRIGGGFLALHGAEEKSEEMGVGKPKKEGRGSFGWGLGRGSITR